MGCKTLFYRNGYSLVIMNLDTLMEKYTEGGKEKMYKSDFQCKSFREINLEDLNCDIFFYFIETSSINFVPFGSEELITKLCFSR